MFFQKCSMTKFIFFRQIGIRVTGLGKFVWKIPYFETFWKAFTADSKEELLRYLQTSIRDVWSKIGGLTKENVLSLTNQVSFLLNKLIRESDKHKTIFFQVNIKYKDVFFSS